MFEMTYSFLTVPQGAWRTAYVAPSLAQDADTDAEYARECAERAQAYQDAHQEDYDA